jgi:hypothetical protein
MIKLKAIRKRVQLNQFFDGDDIWADIRPLTSTEKNEIQEHLASGMKYEYDKRGTASSMEKNYAATDLQEILMIKLKKGVVAHNIPNEDGTIPEWNDALIAEIDRLDPRVLETIAEAVQSLSFPKKVEDKEEGEVTEGFPTSHGQKPRKSTKP